MTKLLTRLGPAAGAAGDDNLFVEDVFSTYVYDADHGTSPIVNGINLADEGGLVWFKHRTSTYSNILFDTERGTSNHLVSNTTAANAASIGLGSFNTNGFSFSGVNLNVNSAPHVAWTFRKAEGFCDIVTFTGNASNGRQVAHNLGSVPSMIILKRTDGSTYWVVYHKSTGAGNYLFLNTNDAQSPYDSNTTNSRYWYNTAPTSTHFTLSNDGWVNASGGTYVAYVFEEDAIFGEDGDEQICKMGTVTTNGSGTASINLGFEPQFIMAKATNAAENWFIVDIMNGAPNGGDETYLQPNLSSAFATYDFVDINPTGWDFKGLNANQNYVYMAIRRPMKVPEAGTEVFAAAQSANNAAWFTSGFPVDLTWVANPNSGGGIFNVPRITAKKLMYTNTTAAEASQSNADFDYMTGAWDGQNNTDYFAWMFKRAPKFFDVVCLTGNGGGTRNITHNLTVAPEIIIYKRRDGSSPYGDWYIQSSYIGAGRYLTLNGTGGQVDSADAWSSTNPTSTVFTIGPDNNVNTYQYIAYLFATLAGISKVGSVVHSGTTNVDCGFSAGARFVLVKRTDASGDWYVWDSVRGIVSGNDPYLLLNSAAAEVTNTDYIDPLASGFTLTSSFTAGTYIFLAIA